MERAARDGVKRTAADLGIAESMIYSWGAKREQGQARLEVQKLQQAEFARLKRECACLKIDNEFLKQAAAYFAKEQDDSEEGKR